MVESEPIVDTENHELVEGTLGSERTTTIEHYKIGSIKTYEVADTELNILESDSSSLVFNIALSFISMAIPLFISYLACSFPNEALEGMYIAASILLLVFAVVLLYIHYKSKTTTKSIYHKIRNRDN